MDAAERAPFIVKAGDERRETDLSSASPQAARMLVSKPNAASVSEQGVSLKSTEPVCGFSDLDNQSRRWLSRPATKEEYMAEATPWLRVKNWGKFQKEMDVAGAKRAWIKLHNSMLTDPEFIVLPDPMQRDLIFVWLHYSSYPRGKMPNNPSALAAIIPRVTEESIVAMIDQGWLIPCTTAQALRQSRKSSVTKRPKLGPKKKNSVKSAPKSETPTAAEEARADREEASTTSKAFAKELADLWNSLGDTRQIRAISNRRAAAVNARLAQTSREDCIEVVRKARASRWCSKVAFKGRGVDFDWCFTDTYFTRLLEGKYDDAPTYRELTFEKATPSQMFEADRACDRRGTDPSRLTGDQRVDVYNEDFLTVSELARSRGYEIKGMTLTVLAEWYKRTTGRWPHE